MKSVEKLSQSSDGLLCEQYSLIKMRLNKRRRRDIGLLPSFIVDDGSIEGEIVSEVAQDLQCGNRFSQRSLQKLARFTQLMQVQAPSVERGYFAHHVDDLREVVFICAHHQDLSTTQLAMKAFGLRHQMQCVRPGAGCVVECAPPPILSGNPERDSHGDSNGDDAAHRLHPRGLNLRFEVAPTNQLAIHVDTPVQFRSMIRCQQGGVQA